MATQPEPVETREMLSGWRAFHIFYHACHNRLLRRLVAPLIRELSDAGVVDRFFFVRYALGGPHVRRRWRLTALAAERDAQAALEKRAAEFFAEFPSTKPVSLEEVRRTNPVLSGSDSALVSEQYRVYDDNTCVPFPVRFEIARYGGPARFPDSLELFCISSARVLRMLVDRGESSDEWIRAEALRSTAQLAWGLTTCDEQHFLSLAGYGARFLHPRFAACANRAAEYFSCKRPQLMALAGHALDSAREGAFSASAPRLAEALSGLPAADRWYAAANHIHMHGNRLGITNAEEVYLSHMLLLAPEALRQECPEQWRTWWDARPVWARLECAPSLTQATGAAVTTFPEESAE